MELPYDEKEDARIENRGVEREGFVADGDGEEVDGGIERERRRTQKGREREKRE